MDLSLIFILHKPKLYSGLNSKIGPPYCAVNVVQGERACGQNGLQVLLPPTQGQMELRVNMCSK